ncbi:carboxypeptidase-like regulatory domain-containing protein [Aquimarina addita]|uniref:Carboxypeptidase-like regulatory domain-containing protein n=1 Tax=Aquimarina addita TaxID=870485 RepID=A0ABP6UP14_9FLAO
MLKIFNLFILLFIASYSHAQYEIKGKILSSETNPVSFATLQLLNSTNKIIAYAITNQKGEYSIQFTHPGSFIIKVTHISFVPLQEPITIDKEDYVITKSFTVLENAQSLDEVVLAIEPKVMKIQNDTITYNLKKLTDGRENNLAEIIKKLPGVRITGSGQITVNGKVIKKLLIDGEELFKKQHRSTAESITSEMIEGIRYLDKFKDFGNIKGFDNKQMRALDISIKDEFKNRITGDIKMQGGHKDKALAHANVYQLGGQLKIGMIADWNNLGKQSITSYEYQELTSTIEAEDFSSMNENELPDEDAPRFFDPTTDISSRENLFAAISFIYKPSDTFKFSLLNLASNTNQKQQFFIKRTFFENEDLFLDENRNIQSNFFINTTIANLGYQPDDQIFINYKINYSPRKTNEDIKIALINQDKNTNYLQNTSNQGYLLDQQLSIVSRIGYKTLFKWSALATIQKNNDNLDIFSNEPFLGLDFDNDTALFQFKNRNTQRFGYELQTDTKFKNSKLRCYQGIFFNKDNFTSIVGQRNSFSTSVYTDRTNSYIGALYKGKITQKLEYTVDIAYKYLFFKRFELDMDTYFIAPKFYIDYDLSTSKRFDFEYSYDIDIPDSPVFNNASVIQDYFTLQAPSDIKQNAIFASHSFRVSFSKFNSTTGSNFIAFGNYNYAPEFLSLNSSVDTNNTLNTSNIIATNKHQIIIGANINRRIKKLKSNIFINTTGFFSESKNQISLQENLEKTLQFQQKAGMYSGYRKGINYSIGIDYEITQYNATLNTIKTNSTIIKPYLYLTGSLFAKKLLWSFGAEYATFTTDVTNTNFFDLKPSITYLLSKTWKVILEGSNILNMNSAEITDNVNTSNYTERRISNTLEGYAIIGIYYRM